MVYLIQGIAKRLGANRQQSTLTSVNLLSNLAFLNWRFLDKDQNKLTIFSCGLFRILFFNSCKYMILFHKIKHFIPSQLYLHPFYFVQFHTPNRMHSQIHSYFIFSLKNSSYIFCRIQKMHYICIRNQATRALSSAGSEHLVYTQRVGGSNPSAPTT